LPLLLLLPLSLLLLLPLLAIAAAGIAADDIVAGFFCHSYYFY